MSEQKGRVHGQSAHDPFVRTAVFTIFRRKVTGAETKFEDYPDEVSARMAAAGLARDLPPDEEVRVIKSFGLQIQLIGVYARPPELDFES